MTDRIRTCLPFSALRLAVFCGLTAATLTGALAVPAYADNDDHGNRNTHWHEGWREQPHYGYYGQPNVYYTAPPVVYAPPVASFNFMFR